MAEYLLVVVLFLLCAPGAPQGLRAATPLERNRPPQATPLPLGIKSTRPWGLAIAAVRRLNVSLTETLTVVFSRPVLALGKDTPGDDQVPFTLDPEIPGKITWKTSYIAQFTPKGAWPADSEIIFKYNKKLTSFDGFKLDLQNQTEGKVLKTTMLQIALVDVLAQDGEGITKAAKNGLRTGEWMPEVPPKGRMVLAFSVPVSLSLLENKLKIVKLGDGGEKKLVKFGVEKCDEITESGGEPMPELLEDIIEDCLNMNECKIGDFPDTPDETCAVIAIEDKLEIGSEYALRLNAGVKYSKSAGKLKKVLQVTFSGLRKFKIPFLSLKGDDAIGRRFLTFSLPHRLAPSVKSSTLQNAIKITNIGSKEMVDFSLEVLASGSIIRLMADLLPGQKYRIDVKGSSSIKDIYGLPLESSRLEFPTKVLDSFFSPYRAGSTLSILSFESEEDWGRKVATFAQGNISSSESFCLQEFPQLDLWSIKTPEQAQSMLAVLEAGSTDQSLNVVLGEQDGSLKHVSKSLLFSSREKDISKFIGKRGVMATEFCRNGQFFYQLLVETDLQVVFVVATGAVPSTAWVTSMSTGKPVKGAKITVFAIEARPFQDLLLNSESFELVEEGVTNKEGRVSFSNLFDGMHAIVEYKDKFTYVGKIEEGFFVATNPIFDSLVLDRKLITAGEPLYIKGFVLQQEEAMFAPASSLASVSIVVSPSWNTSNVDGAEDRFPVNVSMDYGSYELKLPVPTNARPGTYSVFLEGLEGPVKILGKPEMFVIGDAVPPPARLNVFAPQWVHPLDELNIEIVAEAFFGASARDSDMKMLWYIQEDDRRAVLEEPVFGEIGITVDEFGRGTATLNLTELNVTPGPNSTVEVIVLWTGPGRETLQQKRSVRLELDDVQVVLQPSLSTNVPDHGFSVKAQVLGSTTKDANVSVVLKKIDNRRVRELLAAGYTRNELQESFPAAKLFDKPLVGKKVHACKLVSGDLNTDCRMKLPSIGSFLLEACLEVDGGFVCGRKLLGKTQEEWENEPLSSYLDIGVSALDEGPFVVGQKVHYKIENPYRNAYTLLTWGSQLGIDQKVVKLEDATVSEIDIELGEQCVADCELSIVVAIPRQTQGVAANVTVPIAGLFDPAQPHTITHTDRIVVKQDREVSAQISFPDASLDLEALDPGADISIQIDVNQTEETEVTVIVVNRKLLDVVPYVLPRIASNFMLDLGAKFSVTSNVDYLAATKAIDRLVASYKRLKELDPWAVMDLQLNSRRPRITDIPEERYIDIYSELVTTMAALGDGRSGLTAFQLPNSVSIPLEASNSTDMGDVQAVLSSSAEMMEDTDEVSIVETLSAPTVLFQTLKTEGGVAALNFTVPVKLGNYVVRAFVATGDAKFGSTETEFTVKNGMALQARVPPYVRMGDKFELSLEVTVQGEELPEDEIEPPTIVGVVNVDLALEVEGESEFDLGVLESGTATVWFKFTARRLGVARIEFMAKAGETMESSTVVEVPVKGKKEEGTVLLSRPLSGGTKKWQKSLEFPKAQPGFGALDVHVGLGKLPIILSMANSLYKMNPKHECPVSADYALSLVPVPFILDAYGVLKLNSTELDTVTNDILGAAMPNFNMGLESLKVMSNETEGLQEVKLCNGSQTKRGWMIDQTTRGLLILRSVRTMIKENKLKGIQEEKQELAKLDNRWASSLITELVRKADRRRKVHGLDLDLTEVTLGRAVLGWDVELPEGASENAIKTLSMNRLKLRFKEMTTEQKVYYLSALQQAPEGANTEKEIDKTLTSLGGSIQSGLKSAFLAVSNTSFEPISHSANALALIALVKEGGGPGIDNSLIDKLAKHVANAAYSRFGLQFLNSFERALSMLALRRYDEWKETEPADLKGTVKVRLRDNVILEHRFDKSTAPIKSTSVPLTDQEFPDTSLEHVVDKTGPLTIASSFTYMPTGVPTASLFQGILLERRILPQNADRLNLPSLTRFPQGTVIAIVVDFTVSEKLEGVEMRMPVPSGVVMIGRQLDGKRASCRDLGIRLFIEGVPRLNCPDLDFTGDSITLRYRSLDAGIHTEAFFAIANIVGSYTLPPVEMTATYPARVAGLSPANRFEICSGEDCKIRTREKTSPALYCGENCNKNGLCNVGLGACSCFVGFGGKFCGDFMN